MKVSELVKQKKQERQDRYDDFIRERLYEAIGEVLICGNTSRANFLKFGMHERIIKDYPEIFNVTTEERPCLKPRWFGRFGELVPNGNTYTVWTSVTLNLDADVNIVLAVPRDYRDKAILGIWEDPEIIVK